MHYCTRPHYKEDKEGPLLNVCSIYSVTLTATWQHDDCSSRKGSLVITAQQNKNQNFQKTYLRNRCCVCYVSLPHSILGWPLVLDCGLTYPFITGMILGTCHTFWDVLIITIFKVNDNFCRHLTWI